MTRDDEQIIEELIASGEGVTDFIGHDIAALKAALALVKALPVTADGCRVVPGTPVYHHDFEGSRPLIVDYVPVEESAFSWIAQEYKRINGKDFPDESSFFVMYEYWESDTGYHEEFMATVEECYSTKAAAKAKP